MQFPVYQVPYLGNGMVIGLNATIHVLLSHGVVIGLFAMVVLGDWADLLGFGASSEAWERHKRRLLTLTVSVATTVGALTGVGIWFTTSALAPRAIGSMLRIFFWPWFAEWVVFVLELVGLITYYLLWDKLVGPRRPLRIYLGLLYVALSMATAVIITGILGFMLTPGEWPFEHEFWRAFFNPSYPPQLLLRLSLAFVLGAQIAVAVLMFSPEARALGTVGLRLYGLVLAIALPVLVLALVWYFLVVPKVHVANSLFSVLTSRLSQSTWLFVGLNTAGALLLTCFAVTAWRGHVRASRRLVIAALVVTAAFVGEFERIREFIRGPYLLPGYMYANSVLLQEQPFLMKNGMLTQSQWCQPGVRGQSVEAEGAFLFSQNCSACHTIGGLNDIRARVRGRSEDGLFVILAHTHEMVSFMPPFSGTTEERRKLASFLAGLSSGTLRMRSLARHTVAQEGGANRR